MNTHTVPRIDTNKYNTISLTCVCTPPESLMCSGQQQCVMCMKLMRMCSRKVHGICSSRTLYWISCFHSHGGRMTNMREMIFVFYLFTHTAYHKFWNEGILCRWYGAVSTRKIIHEHDEIMCGTCTCQNTQYPADIIYACKLHQRAPNNLWVSFRVHCHEAPTGTAQHCFMRDN